MNLVLWWLLAVPKVTGKTQEQEPGVLILRGNRSLMLDLFIMIFTISSLYRKYGELSKV